MLLIERLKKLYQNIIPSDLRYKIYVLRNPGRFKNLRKSVHTYHKGNFSLRACDKYKCIFVHITKSAGTSVAQSLFGELPSHFTATQYRAIFGRTTFNNYFKFTFVRNPWDRLYSSYCYLKGGGWNDFDRSWANNNLDTISGFDEFVCDWLTPERLRSHIHFVPQGDFIYASSGRILIDYLGYFETIHEDFSLIAKQLGLTTQLHHTNASSRDGYLNVYSKNAIQKVADLYKEDIANFGYSFSSFTKMEVINGKLRSAKNLSSTQSGQQIPL